MIYGEHFENFIVNDVFVRLQLQICFIETKIPFAAQNIFREITVKWLSSRLSTVCTTNFNYRHKGTWS